MKFTCTVVAMMCFWIITPQDIRYTNGCEPITLSKNQILINGNIDGAARFAVDFGLSESTFVGTKTAKKKNHNIGNRLFSGWKSFVENAPTGSACNDVKVVGHIGYDIFRKSAQIFELDFDAQRLCCLTPDQAVGQRTNYQEIDADFRNDGIYIPVTLRWKKYDVKFDTGYDGTISMTSKDAAQFLKESCKKYEANDEVFAVYPNKWVTINGSYYNASVTVSDQG